MRKPLPILCVATIVIVAGALCLPRMAQPQAYHSFADQRSWLGIPRFLDVASNLPFAIFGLMGLGFLLSSESRIRFVDQRERWPYLVAFIGLLLTAIGSSYYHLGPSNARLVWDRIPMTLVFMSLVAAILVERIDLRVGLLLLPFLLVLGVSSVVQWYASELRGSGDLRFYATVQVYSAVVLLLAPLFPSSYTRGADLLALVGFYVMAKVLESADRAIFDIGHVVSGHTLKHITAAMAGYWILRMLRLRVPLKECSDANPSVAKEAAV